MKKTSREPSRLYDLIPNDAKSHHILVDRAKHLASYKEEQEYLENYKNYICFNLGKNEKYGIPYSYASEVMNVNEVTPVPQLPKIISGVMNWRGKLLTILDMNIFFNLEAAEKNAKPYVIVTSAHGMMIGILANNIIGDSKYDPNNLQPTIPMKDVIKQEYILGLHEGSIAILNMDAILADIKGVIKQ